MLCFCVGLGNEMLGIAQTITFAMTLRPAADSALGEFVLPQGAVDATLVCRCLLGDGSSCSNVVIGIGASTRMS